ncbi:hypothetical protein PPL_10873 [Heterostelium album PN500]|uniref:Uncharacterized protein n=1 Tax=Heterostelium pallidum (strain ATCC 26659 / Pp 5 / PN500) TaxID=670386 RepID=D3BS81_HETP5|nr:hypothetical protein PPL_10873 [Heterostelium album PN500]EFA75818.1 hypothetical protein PPL_10873 [Heterostelium album PN500]|eukprot:XP_020427952.1 hypothetical protein PPL_10873 [Heterostelium album PN500]
MSNNNNSTHKLVNLPHILISIIVHNLTDNIDKICFSLVCKRWFDNRNRYLLFDTKRLYCIDKDSSRITLNSYRSLITESLSQKKQCSLLVNSEKNYNGLYDHIMDIDSIESINEIDQNIVNVELDSRIEAPDKLFARLYELISKSNVTSIEKCTPQTLKYGIPANITSIVFEHYFNEPLLKGCFPPTLKTLKLVGIFNQVIEVGVLPDTLECLEISNLDQILEPGVLPASLKILKIWRLAPENYLKVGSLPPNLEEFIHDGNDFNIDANVLPNSLIRLVNAPVLWMNSIKQLTNLRSLLIIGHASCLDLGDLPKSLTTLDLSGSLEVLSACPTSIRHLSLDDSEYDIDQLFPDRSLYHFESLVVWAFKQESLKGLDIKRLILIDQINTESLGKIRVIPYGIETLEIAIWCDFSFNQEVLPSSLKTLNVTNMDSFTHPGIIPNSVNNLIIRDLGSDINIPEGILPDSVKNIQLTQLLFPTAKMIDNITYEGFNNNKCSIRKLDDQYYIVFGHQSNQFIASLFHKSMFLDSIKVSHQDHLNSKRVQSYPPKYCLEIHNPATLSMHNRIRCSTIRSYTSNLKNIVKSDQHVEFKTIKYDKTNFSEFFRQKNVFYIDDNIDIICFSLVCKRWYNDRDKYLMFNTDNICLFAYNTSDINQNNKHFNLPSYYNTFMNSIQSKINLTLVFGYSTYQCPNYDYHYNEFEKLKGSIPCKVSNIYITFNSSDEIDELEKFYRLISESQSVTKLEGCSTLIYGLPKSIKSLSFRGFDEPIKKGSLPDSLEVLDFDRFFKQEILPGVLPDGLLELTLINYQYEIRPGVLPNSLLSLTINGSPYEIQAGILPAGLLSLSLYDYPHELRPCVLPSTLTYLSLKCYEYTQIDDLAFISAESATWEDSVITKSYVPISWLQAISSLLNLQSLEIYFSYRDQESNVFNLKYLPPTLESLEISITSVVLIGTMPASLKNIHLNECQFIIDEIFPETKQYHFEVFGIDNNSILRIPSNIKIDELFITGEITESTISLPSYGVKSIYFYTGLYDSGEKIIDFGDVDNVTDQTCSLRELHLPTFMNGTPKFKIPNTIEQLHIGDNDLNDILHLIPSTLNTLSFNSNENQSEIDITNPNFFKSIPKIIRNFGTYSKQTIRKLDENYYLIYNEFDNEQNVRLICENSLTLFNLFNQPKSYENVDNTE